MKCFSNCLRVKQPHRTMILAFVWAVLSTLLSSISATAAPPTPVQVAQAKAELRTYYAWINALWTQDDRPYQRIHDDIEQALATGENSKDVLKRYQAVWYKGPHDYQAQFGYYYAAYKYATDRKTDEADVNPQILYNLSTSLIRSPHPHTYNYVRAVRLP